MSVIRPLVGITCQFDPSPSNRNPQTMDGVHRLSESYCRAIRESGGLPILLPTTPVPEARVEYLRAVDALVFSGGGDIDPSEFGEEPHPALGNVDPLRDDFEMALCRDALDLNLPILAICKGSQVLNVVAGGTILQDIAAFVPSPLQHAQKSPAWRGSHRVEIAPGSLLAKWMGGESARVNSFHHQSIGKVGAGFRATARTSDGVIEAIESLTHDFVVGVQFHPEGMFDASEAAAGLFRGLIEACRVSRERVLADATNRADSH